MIGGAARGGTSARLNNGSDITNVANGMLFGAITGGLGSAIAMDNNSNMKLLGKLFVSKYIGAWTGGVMAGITGGDVGKGMRNGAISAGVGFLVSWSYQYVKEQQAKKELAEFLLGIDDAVREQLKSYGLGKLDTHEFSEKTTEVWKQLRSMQSEYGMLIEYAKTMDYDKNAVIKFSNMHIRFGTQAMIDEGATNLKIGEINVHYDRFDIVTYPVLHFFGDWVWQLLVGGK